MSFNPRRWLPAFAITLFLVGCGDNKDAAPASTEKAQAPARATIISTARVESSFVEVIEHSVGSLESIIRPEVSAEVEGRYIGGFVFTGQRVKLGQLLAELDTEDYAIAARAADAEAAQLDALVKNQRRTVKRYAKLIDDKLISIDRYDDAQAQLDSLEEQLKGANARRNQKQRGLTKTRVLSAYDGIVDEELASPGDFLKVGDPLFRIIKVDKLRARLPLPETLANRLTLGLKLRLVSPMAPGLIVESSIQEIRPTVGSRNRAIDILTIIDNPGPWQPGASVTGEIILTTRDNAILVPKTSLVLRPAGKVVYVITGGIAHQQLVEVGEYVDGKIEITAGLEGGETIAVNGAGFLTDGSPVMISGVNKP